MDADSQATRIQEARSALLYNPKKPKTMINTMDVPPTVENEAYAKLLAAEKSGGRRKNRSHHKRRRGGRSSKRMRRTYRR